MEPLVLFGLAIVAALCSYALGGGKGLGALIIIMVVAGVAASAISTDALQVFLMIGSYFSPLIIGASVIGLAVGVNLRKKQRYLVSALLLVPFPYLIWNIYSTEVQQASEKILALDYITHNKQIIELAGGPVKIILASSTTYKDRGRYEFGIIGLKTFYAIVDVSRRWFGKSEVSVACVTTLSMGCVKRLKMFARNPPFLMPK